MQFESRGSCRLLRRPLTTPAGGTRGERARERDGRRVVCAQVHSQVVVLPGGRGVGGVSEVHCGPVGRSGRRRVVTVGRGYYSQVRHGGDVSRNSAWSVCEICQNRWFSAFCGGYRPTTPNCQRQHPIITLACSTRGPQRPLTANFSGTERLAVRRSARVCALTGRACCKSRFPRLSLACVWCLADSGASPVGCGLPLRGVINYIRVRYGGVISRNSAWCP